MARCKATRKDGGPCEADALTLSDYCAFHDPEKAETFHNGRVKGGEAGKLATLATVKPWRGAVGDVDVMKAVSPAELVNLLCNTIDDVLTGAIDPKVANAVGYLTGAIVKIQQYEALVERLSAIEEALQVRGKS
jgi:hypothetical protein